MSQVWKVGSRWGETGHKDSSILDIFRRHNVVFVGVEQGRFKKIQEGDLIGIADGLKIVAVGMATSVPQPITELGIPFSEDDKRAFDYEDQVIGCKVSYADIPNQEEWVRCPPGAFRRFHARANELQAIYDKLQRDINVQQEFEIRAKSCTLLHNEKHSDEVLWRKGYSFRVPIYQRPYSWGEQQIQRFVNDLLAAFAGANGRPKQEPMFIGTMQLKNAVLVDKQQDRWVHDVVDGQQRLSTLMLLLKILRDRAPDAAKWADLAIDTRLTTAVSSGTQQRYLSEALAADSAGSLEAGQNPYLKAIPLIRGFLDNADRATDGDNGADPQAPMPLDVPGFVTYLTSKVYFVVIETCASLSKTLQIFDAINTSGMDLNGGDIFKVRYYEYLQMTKRVGEEAFNRISALYQAIDDKNRDFKRRVTSIEGILSLVQHVLVARHGMAKVLHDYGASTFFERFFDVRLRVDDWANYNRMACDAIDLGIEEIDRLIGVRYEWERTISMLGAEARSMLEFIRWSRYRAYEYLIVLFRDRYGADLAMTEQFIVQLSKLFVIYSILYWRTVNELHGIIRGVNDESGLLGMICGARSAASADQIIAYINGKIAAQRAKFSDALNNYELTGNERAKTLACRCSAMLDELPLPEATADKVMKIIFGTSIDIEHIESYNHKDEAQRERVHKEYGPEINRIGNLVVLESSVNRSISNEDYQRVKIPAYAAQKEFEIVRKHAKLYPKWGKEQCLRRKGEEVKKLVDYLCG